MDLFRVDRASRRKGNGVEDRSENVLPHVYPMQDGHYLRYIGDEVFSCCVVIDRRKTVQRMKSMDPKVIGWSTRNTLVKKSDEGIEVGDIESLVKAIAEWEAQET